MPVAVNPFPGLRPFEYEEADRYFGRDVVLDQLLTAAHLAPVTPLFARSGVGKSSFLQCRVKPALLQQSDRVAEVREWGSAPATVLVGNALEHARFDGIGYRPVLILDQFEDVFKIEGNCQDDLWELLASKCGSESAYPNVIISLREEWLGSLCGALDYIPGLFQAAIRLEPLNALELRTVIEGAVSSQIRKEHDFDEPFITRLLHDLSIPNAYGLGETNVEIATLQLVCHKLWDEAVLRGTGRIDEALYENLGGGSQIISDFVRNRMNHAAQFGFHDHVLWMALTRYLVVPGDAKAIVSARSVSEMLQEHDFGPAGSFVLPDHVSRGSRRYLTGDPRYRRDGPPTDLQVWVETVLVKGVLAGLLRERHTLQGDRHFELSHDAFGRVLKDYALEVQRTVASHLRKARRTFFSVVGVGVTLVLLISIFAIGIFPNQNIDPFAIAAVLALSAIALLIFILIGKISDRLFDSLARPYVSASVKKRLSALGTQHKRITPATNGAHKEHGDVWSETVSESLTSLLTEAYDQYQRPMTPQLAERLYDNMKAKVELGTTDVLKGKKILWLHKDPKHDELESYSLKACGAFVNWCFTVPEALQMISSRDEKQQAPYDLIISHMGQNQDAFTLAVQLPESHVHQPIVIYTRHVSDPAFQEKARDLGILYFTNLPDQLFDKVIDAIQERQPSPSLS